jgi:DNA-binding MarR family transcriptional regulator
MPKIEPTVPQDKRVIEALMSALMPFNDFQTQMPLAYMLSFLAVVREEGKPIAVYAQQLDLERFIIGRYFQVLGDRGRHGKPGLGLVKVKRTQVHEFKTEVYLTAKGRAVAAQVLQNLRPFTQK